MFIVTSSYFFGKYNEGKLGIKCSHPGFVEQQGDLNIGPLEIQGLINGSVKSYYIV